MLLRCFFASRGSTHPPPSFPQAPATITEEDCNPPPPSTTDILMQDVIAKLPFDNPDGGVWKQVQLFLL